MYNLNLPMFAPEATLASLLMDCKSANHWALIIVSHKFTWSSRSWFHCLNRSPDIDVKKIYCLQTTSLNSILGQL